MMWVGNKGKERRGEERRGEERRDDNIVDLSMLRRGQQLIG